MQKIYTEEMISFISENYKKEPISCWLGKFNEKFGTNKSDTAIRSVCKKKGISAGRSGKFQKGGPYLRKNSAPTGKQLETMFGGKRSNSKGRSRVGSTRLNQYGHELMKVAHPNKWRRKKDVIWEEVNGKIPCGHIVRLFDNSAAAKADPKIDNLFLVNRHEYMSLNRNNFKDVPHDYKQTALLISKLTIKVKQLSKQ